MQNNKLYIPVSIKTQFEFFNGFGVPELIKTMAVSSIALIIAIFINSFSESFILPVLIVLISISASIIALTKDSNNLSVIDQIKYVLRFSKAQKKYPYYYTDEWGANV